MLRRIVLSLIALVLVVPGLRAQDFYWTGNGSDALFSNPDNWFDGVAPTDYAETITFANGAPVAFNDLPNLSVDGLIFSGSGGFNIGGNAINGVYQIGSFGGLASENAIGTAIYANQPFAIVMSSLDQLLVFTNTMTVNDGGLARIYGFSALDNGAIFSGVNGALVTTGSATVELAQATLDIDNSFGADAGRLSPDFAISMVNAGRLRLIGDGGATGELLQEVSALQAYTSEILEVRNNGSSFATVLQVNELKLGGGAVVLNRSTGEAGEVLGTANGPQIKYAGQGDSSFLGPQQFYMSGDLENAAGNVEYAAYSTATGVISASTGTNNLLTATAADNVLQTESIFLDDADVAVHSIAFNGDFLAGTGTVSLTHFLTTRPGAAIYVDLDFGNTDGTITVENWDNSDGFLGAYFANVISGSNTLTFRGSGDVNLMAENTFSGTVAILGAAVSLSDEGRLGEVSAIVLGTEGKSSTLAFHGGDYDHVADDAPITIAGMADINVFADGETYNERLGNVTVTAQGKDPIFSYTPIRLNTFGAEEAPVTLTLSSLTFAASSSNAQVELYTYNQGDSIVIEGGPIVLEHGNALSINLGYLFQANTSITLEGGVMIAADAEGTVYLNSGTTSTLIANLDLQGGELYGPSSQGLLSMEGDLTMGEMLTTVLGLNNPDEVSPLIAIEGNLTLDGTLSVSQNSAFQEGTWLLFSVTGLLVDNGWTVVGTDGAYAYYIDGGNVYLTTVPEPTTGVLLVAGMLALGARRRRRS